jgi:urea transporter
MPTRSSYRLAGAWEKAAKKRYALCLKWRPARWVDIILRSYGQLWFADSIITGLFLLIALALISKSTFLFSLIGASVSSLAAFFFKEDRLYIHHGIFGFNGALLGIFWGWYFAITVTSVVILFLAAIIATRIQTYLMKRLSQGRFNLPVLSLPAVAVLVGTLIVVYWLVYNARVFPPLSIYTPAGFTPKPLIKLSSPGSHRFLQALFSQNFLAWSLIFIGIIANSRISAFAALMCGTAGYFIVHIPAFRGIYAPYVFIGFNLIPLGIGLFGFFFVANIRTFFFTFAGIGICTILWILFAKCLGLLNIPFLTLPFNITIILYLIIASHQGSMTREQQVYPPYRSMPSQHPNTTTTDTSG